MSAISPGLRESRCLDAMKPTAKAHDKWSNHPAQVGPWKSPFVIRSLPAKARETANRRMNWKTGWLLAVRISMALFLRWRSGTSLPWTAGAFRLRRYEIQTLPVRLCSSFIFPGWTVPVDQSGKPIPIPVFWGHGGFGRGYANSGLLGPACLR